MYNRAWKVVEEQFIEVWKGADTIDGAVARVKDVAGGKAPRWTEMAKAADLRRAGSPMKEQQAGAAA